MSALSDASARAAKPSAIPSLAARLTAWYAASAFALILAATGVLYLALEKGLDADNDRVLADRLVDVRNVLNNQSNPHSELADQLEVSASPRQRTPIYVRVIDEAGNVFIESPEMSRRLPHIEFSSPLAIEEGAGTEGMIQHGEASHRYRVIARKIDVRNAQPSTQPSDIPRSPVMIEVALSLAPQEKLLAGYRKRLWIAMSVALVACIAVGYEIARRGIRPIRDITNTARTIKSTTLDARIDATPMPSEVRLLAGEFNEMLDRLQESFARISRFSADIAHELRTPVNNLRGTAEVALNKARSVEEYQDALVTCTEECTRLTHIIENLLFLARAEDPRHQIQRETLDVGHELQTVAEFYEVAASEAGVSIEVANELHRARPLAARLNRTLFQRAVGNLLSNSILHTPAGGKITVSAERSGGNMLNVRVTDTGRGIPDTHLPRVFDRLYRVADDRSTHSGGAGLGLAIVKSIAQSHGGSVGITSILGNGTSVTISLPVD